MRWKLSYLIIISIGRQRPRRRRAWRLEKINSYFTQRISNCLGLFSIPMAIKNVLKQNMYLPVVVHAHQTPLKLLFCRGQQRNARVMHKARAQLSLLFLWHWYTMKTKLSLNSPKAIRSFRRGGDKLYRYLFLLKWPLRHFEPLTWTPGLNVDFSFLARTHGVWMPNMEQLTMNISPLQGELLQLRKKIFNDGILGNDYYELLLNLIE